MSLPANDLAFLNERGITHQVVPEGGMICVILPQWPLPTGFNQCASDLLLRLHPGYPDVPPDMWWFSPAVRLVRWPGVAQHQRGSDISGALLAAVVAALPERTVEIRG